MVTSFFTRLIWSYLLQGNQTDFCYPKSFAIGQEDCTVEAASAVRYVLEALKNHSVLSLVVSSHLEEKPHIGDQRAYFCATNEHWTEWPSCVQAGQRKTMAVASDSGPEWKVMSFACLCESSFRDLCWFMEHQWT